MFIYEAVKCIFLIQLSGTKQNKMGVWGLKERKRGERGRTEMGAGGGGGGRKAY